MSKHTTSKRQHKPSKPHPDFPLFPHATGRWAKKVKGKLHYFGPWADPQAALERWLAQKDDLLAGRVPRDKLKGATLSDLCNRFLTAKLAAVRAKQPTLSQRSYYTYYFVCEELVRLLGADRLLSSIGPDDFERIRADWNARYGIMSVHSRINIARVILGYAFNQEMVDRPFRFGDGFRRPSKRLLLQNRLSKRRFFERDEVLRILAAAKQPLRTMILLGINAALGNSDLGRLKFDHLDLEGGWLNYPRGKTGVQRRCPLWPETVQALKDWLSIRPGPMDRRNAELVFLTRHGRPWTIDSLLDAEKPLGPQDKIVDAFTKIIRPLGITGIGFYGLRHAFRTIADGCLDQVAINTIMGHSDGSMAANYRHRVDDARLRGVVEHVRQWLFGKEGGGE